MQVRSFRCAEAQIAIRKRCSFTGVRIAAAQVPGDQFVALRDHRHRHGSCLPFASDEIFGAGEQGFADTARLQSRTHRQHAEIGVGVAPLELYASIELRVGIGQCGAHQHRAIAALRRRGDKVGERGMIGALAAEQIGFGGPADPARVTAIRGIHKFVQRGDVTALCGAQSDAMVDVGLRHGFIVRRAPRLIVASAGRLWQGRVIGGSMPVNRRRFLIAAGALAATPAVVSCSRTPEQRPPGVPVSRFGAESTALEVTAGVDLTGRTILVTGATSGLGLETMRVLALRGAHVIGSGRTLDKAKAACESVQGRTTPIALELERWDSIVTATDLVRTLGMPLDGIVCNAGIMALPQLEQVYGLEKHLVVNHLGHFILVNRLLPQVQAAPQGRVVVVSSLGYQWAPEAGIEFDNLDGRRGYEPNRMYGQSKLANGLFSLELARRLRESGATATSNSVHPGIINTNLGRHFAAWKRAAGKLIGWTFMKSVEAGAATSCYVATAPALASVSGHYFEDCNPVVPKAGKHMEDAALAGALWKKSEELTARYLA